MKNSLQISAAINHLELLEGRVEQLSYRHYDLGYGKQQVPADYEALETSSAEVYVSGTMAMSNSRIQVNIPFITCFVFTCVKRKDSVYKLEWGSSLS